MTHAAADLPLAGSARVMGGHLVFHWENETTLRFAFEKEAGLLCRGIRFSAPGRARLTFGTFDVHKVEFDIVGMDPTAIGQHDRDHPMYRPVVNDAERAIVRLVVELSHDPTWAERFLDMAIDRSIELMKDLDARRDRGREFDDFYNDRLRTLDSLDQCLLTHAHPFSEGLGYVLLQNGQPMENPRAEPWRWTGMISRFVFVHAGEAYRAARTLGADTIEKVMIRDQAVLLLPREGTEPVELTIDRIAPTP